MSAVPAAMQSPGTGVRLIGAFEPVRTSVGGDSCSKRGAQRAARDLAAWWQLRGYKHARFRAESVVAAYGCHPAIWGVRSNLVNGAPPTRPTPLPKVRSSRSGRHPPKGRTDR